MMCSKCGAQIQEGAKFCGACGTPLIVLTSSAVQIEEGVSTATIPERSARPRLWQNRTTAFLVAAVVVFGFTLLIVLTTRNRRTLMLPELESLFRQSRSCPLIKEWVVDFAGGGRPYLLELRHCSSAQMSKFELPKHLEVDKWVSGSGSKLEINDHGNYDYLIVLRKSLLGTELVHGEVEIGGYSKIETPILLQQHREAVVVEGRLEGSGGFSSWCLLAQKDNGDISCWYEQTGIVNNHIRPYLRSDEDAKAWHLGSKNGQLFMATNVEARGDSNCCPTRGMMSVELIPDNGILRWGAVTRDESFRSFSVGSERESVMKPEAAPLSLPGSQMPPEEDVTLHPYDLLKNPYAYKNRVVRLKASSWPVLYNGQVMQYSEAHNQGGIALGYAGVRFERMLSDGVALYDVLGAYARSGGSELQVLGQLGVGIPSNGKLDVQRSWDVEPLGATEGRNAFGVLITVPVVKFWRYSDEKYANQPDPEPQGDALVAVNLVKDSIKPTGYYSSLKPDPSQAKWRAYRDLKCADCFNVQYRIKLSARSTAAYGVYGIPSWSVDIRAKSITPFNDEARKMFDISQSAVGSNTILADGGHGRTVDDRDAPASTKLNAEGLRILSATHSDLNVAKRAFEKAVQLDSSNIEALNNLGYVNSRIGDYRTAETVLFRVLAIAPTRRVALGNLAYVQAKLGKTLDAVNHFCQYVRQFDTLEHGKSTLVRVMADPDPNVQAAVEATVANCTR